MNTNYRTALMNRPFMYIESKRVANLLDGNLTSDEIQERVVQENLLQLPSLDRKRTMLREITIRLSFLDSFLLEQFITAPSETSKLLLAYGVLASDKLFKEFSQEVYLEKLLQLDLVLTKKEVVHFFERKSMQNSVVRNWREGTKERLANGYLQMLVESGMVEKTDNDYLIRRNIVKLEVADYLKEHGDKKISEIVLGELL